MIKNSIFLSAAVLFQAVSGAALADVYRWTDEQGNVHFGSQPPPGYTADDTGLRSTRGAVDGDLGIGVSSLYGDWVGSRAGRSVSFVFNRAGYFMEIITDDRNRQIRSYIGRWSMHHRLLDIALLKEEEGASLLPKPGSIVVESYRQGVLALRFEDGELAFFRRSPHSSRPAFPPEFRH